jgi:hypothetical protein
VRGRSRFKLHHYRRARHVEAERRAEYLDSERRRLERLLALALQVAAAPSRELDDVAELLARALDTLDDRPMLAHAALVVAAEAVERRRVPVNPLALLEVLGAFDGTNLARAALFEERAVDPPIPTNRRRSP